MRICMKLFQAMNLEVVNIPDRLGDTILDGLVLLLRRKTGRVARLRSNPWSESCDWKTRSSIPGTVSHRPVRGLRMTI